MTELEGKKETKMEKYETSFVDRIEYRLSFKGKKYCNLTMIFIYYAYYLQLYNDNV